MTRSVSDYSLLCIMTSSVSDYSFNCITGQSEVVLYWISLGDLICQNGHGAIWNFTVPITRNLPPDVSTIGISKTPFNDSSLTDVLTFWFIFHLAFLGISAFMSSMLFYRLRLCMMLPLYPSVHYIWAVSSSFSVCSCLFFICLQLKAEMTTSR